MDKFLERHKLIALTHEDIKNRFITYKGTELVIGKKIKYPQRKAKTQA